MPEDVQYESADDLLSNNDLASAEVSMPLIDKQTKRIRLGEQGKVEVRESKGQEKLRYLLIPFQLEEVATSTSGNELPVGRKFTHRILVTPVGNLTQAMINEKLARFQTAALGTPKAVNNLVWSSLNGRELLARFSVSTSKKDSSRLNQEVDFVALPTSGGTP